MPQKQSNKLENKIKSNYCRAIVIVHGYSELLMAKYIISNLRLNMKIISRNNGRSSIQVDGLTKFINSNSTLRGTKTISDEFGVQIYKSKLIDFKIFTIMDLDDCEEDEATKYKTGDLFFETKLKEYIEPIWFEPQFDVAMKKSNLIKNLPNDKEKGNLYERVFKVNDNNGTGLENVMRLREKLKQYKNTNIINFIDYCIETSKESQNSRLNKETINAIKDSKNNKNLSKRFNDIDELFADLDK